MTNKKTPTSTSRRAALRAQQEAQAAAQKRRRIIAVIVGVVVAAIILAVILGINHKSDGSASSTQITPPSATKTGVYTLNPDKVKKDAPTVTVYQDYQCPKCKAVEDALGKQLNELSTRGEIRLQYHTMTFLDQRIEGENSQRAAMAAAAADVVGKYEAYHDAVYSRQTEQFVNEANDKGLHKMQDLDVPGTPAFAVNDKLWEGWEQLGNNPTPDELLKAIDAAK